MGSSSPPALRRLRLKSDDCAPADLFARWRAALGGMFEVRATPSEIATFRGEIDVHASARHVLSASWHSSLSLIRHRASGSPERFAVSLKIGGPATGPGDVMFIDLTQALAMREAPEGFAHGVTLWTARERILPLVADESGLHGVALKAVEPAGAVIGAALRAFARTVADMRLADFDALAEGLIALAAKSAAPAIRPDGAAPPPLASFVTIRRHIERNLASPVLGAERIADEFRLSRASLYRLFEPVGGVAKYIRKARLSRAFQEIAAPELANRRISDIAASLGFRNVGALGRAFHDAYGVTPREARNRARKAAPKSEYAAPAEPGESLSRWIEALAV